MKDVEQALRERLGQPDFPQCTVDAWEDGYRIGKEDGLRSKIASSVGTYEDAAMRRLPESGPLTEISKLKLEVETLNQKITRVENMLFRATTRIDQEIFEATKDKK